MLTPYQWGTRKSRRTGETIYVLEFIAAPGPQETLMQDQLVKAGADFLCKLLGLSNPPTVAAVEDAASKGLAFGMAVFTAVVSAEAEKRLAAAAPVKAA